MNFYDGLRKYNAKFTDGGLRHRGCAMTALWHRIRGHRVKPIYRRKWVVSDTFSLIAVRWHRASTGVLYYLGWRRNGEWCSTCKRRLT